mmetsp:Transcript_5854/g.9376  ORF Transcript_5854/g.9376 Transcript_5854/m.9376 type:complete len:139 (+) Transcript_5854:373-789(+)
MLMNPGVPAYAAGNRPTDLRKHRDAHQNDNDSFLQYLFTLTVRGAERIANPLRSQMGTPLVTFNDDTPSAVRTPFVTFNSPHSQVETIRTSQVETIRTSQVETIGTSQLEVSQPRFFDAGEALERMADSQVNGNIPHG